MVYLDYNATAPLRPGVLDAMESTLAQGRNPMSPHRLGRRARVMLDRSRDSVQRLVGAGGCSVVVTSGGTEADNLAVMGIGARRLEEVGARRIIVSGVEHAAVATAGKRLRKMGIELETVPVESSGQVCLDALERTLGPDVALVAVMLANNETGVIQPVREVSALAAAHGVPVHCDAVQCAGKIPIDFNDLGLHSMAVAAHKFGGPRGIGALILRKGLRPAPLWLGGDQEEGLRSGSQAVALAVGMGYAAEEALSELSQVDHHRDLRDRFERSLVDGKEFFVVGADAPRLPNTSAVAFVGYQSVALVRAFDELGVMASGGAACHSGAPIPSEVMLAMGLSTREALSVVRFSMGWSTGASDVDLAVKRVSEALERMPVSP